MTLDRLLEDHRAFGKAMRTLLRSVERQGFGCHGGIACSVRPWLRFDQYGTELHPRAPWLFVAGFASPRPFARTTGWWSIGPGLRGRAAIVQPIKLLRDYGRQALRLVNEPLKMLGLLLHPLWKIPLWHSGREYDDLQCRVSTNLFATEG